MIEETERVNREQNREFDITNSLLSKIPHFACPNVFRDIKIYRDIEKYLYCEKFNVPPYKGSYDEQPAMWVRKSFAIKSAIAKKEKRDIDATRQNTN